MSARITVMIQAQRTVSLFHELTVYDDIRERDKSLYMCVFSVKLESIRNFEDKEE